MKVSIIITAYNVEKYISKTIQSVLNQTYKNIECIVVEDKSTDNTLNIIKQFPVKIIEHQTNKGAGWARFNGIKEATGEYVMLLDGDDWLENDCIENLVKYAGQADLIACNVRWVNEDDKILNEEKFKYSELVGYDKYVSQRGHTPFLNSFIVKRELYDKVPYCKRRFIEDTPVRYKLFHYADKIIYTGIIGYNYLQRDGSLCHKESILKRHIFTAITLCELINFFIKNDKLVIKITQMLENFNQEYLNVKYNITEKDQELYKKELEYLDLYWSKLTTLLLNKNKETPQ